MAVLASALEADAVSMYKDVYQQVGAPGTTPNTLLTYLQARARLNNSLAPMDANRTTHLSPLATATIVDALKGLFPGLIGHPRAVPRGLDGPHRRLRLVREPAGPDPRQRQQGG
ncbi:MAG: hypothetical protein WDN45_10450 [Caulobacteraceae bacterium]